MVGQVLAEDGLEAEVRRRRWNPSSASGRTPTSRWPRTPTRRRPTTSRASERKGVPHPLFVYVEGHEPEFLRDLGAH